MMWRSAPPRQRGTWSPRRPESAPARSEGDVPRREAGADRAGGGGPLVRLRLAVARLGGVAERGVRGVVELAVDEGPVPVLSAEPECDVPLPDVPQRSAPDLAVGVHLTDPVLQHPAGVEPA